MKTCGRAKLASLVMGLLNAFATFSLMVLLDMLANEASGGITGATEQSSFFSRNILLLGVPPAVLCLWIVCGKAAKFQRQFQAGGATDGVGQIPQVQSELEDQFNLPHRSPSLPSTSSTLIKHQEEMNWICCGRKFAFLLLGQVTGLAVLLIHFFLAMFANQASNDISKRAVLKNIQYVGIPFLLVVLWIVRHKVRYKEQRQAEATAANQSQRLQSQACFDAESQTVVACDQALLTSNSKNSWKFGRSFGYLRQLWRNIRERNPWHRQPQLDEFEGVSSLGPIKLTTQCKADETIEHEGEVLDVSSPDSTRASPLLEESSGTSQPEDREQPPTTLEMDSKAKSQRRRRTIRRRRREGGPLRNLDRMNEQLGLDPGEDGW